MLLAKAVCLLLINYFLNFTVGARTCHVFTNSSGAITDAVRGQLTAEYFKCWKISVPQGKLARIEMLKVKGINCATGSLIILVTGVDELIDFCNEEPDKIVLKMVALNDAQVHFLLYRKERQKRRRVNSSFELQFEIIDVLCVQKDSFACNNVSCIPNIAVCDGIEDCDNGKDEEDCSHRKNLRLAHTSAKFRTQITPPDVFVPTKIDEIHDDAIYWLKTIRKSWGWGANTQRAIISMYFSSEYSYSASPNLEDSLMAQQLELKTGIALMRNKTKPLTANQLGTYVNAFSATCHDPRHFYGLDLVQLLKDLLEASPELSHPMAYLALCNANESLPLHAVPTLVNLLKRKSNYTFYLDIKAAAVMALSCLKNNSYLKSLLDSNALSYYEETLEQFETLVCGDDGMGNIYTTALVIQAILSNGKDAYEDPGFYECIHYLADYIDSWHINFLSVYWILPILHGKSFAHIASSECLENKRTLGHGNSLEDFMRHWQMDISVQYSLYIGDEKKIVHTLSLSLPENFTALEVMQFSELVDPKFRFKSQKVSGKVYVYEIADITNDAEAGKYWLSYLKSPATNEIFQHFLHVHEEEYIFDTHAEDSGISGDEKAGNLDTDNSGLHFQESDNSACDAVLATEISDNLQQLSIDLNEVRIQDGDHLIMWFKTFVI